MALKTSKAITLDEVRLCYFCSTAAKYDAPTQKGPWAYMCQTHAEQLMKPDWAVGYELTYLVAGTEHDF